MSTAGQYGGPCIDHHRLSIFDRGGTRRVYNLVDVAQVEWERIRDSKSSASFSLIGRSCEAQADIIRDIANATGRYELVIYRGDDRVWEGPIRRVSTFRDQASFLAADIKEYLDATSLSKRWPNPDEGGPPLMGDRLQQIIQYELSTDYSMLTNDGTITVKRWENLTDPKPGGGTTPKPINVLPYLEVRKGTVLTRSVTEAFEMMLGEHIDNLVDGGMDFTVIGRKLLLWDSALSIGRTRRLTDADFYGDIEVIRYGSEHWSISHLSASGGEDDERAVGHAGAVHPYYGAWENIVSQQSEEGTEDPTQTELNTQARRDILHRTPVPIEVRVPDGVGIRLSHDLTINQLIPGVIIPIATALNIQKVTQAQRLDKVKVNETSNQETVQVSMSPFGDVEAL